MTASKRYFGPVPARAAADRLLRGEHFRVLIEIGLHDRFSKNQMGCFAPINRLATKLAMHPSNVRRAIRELIGLGYLRKEAHPRYPGLAMYSIIYDATRDQAMLVQSRRKGVADDTVDSPEDVSGVTPGVSGVIAKGVTPSGEGVDFLELSATNKEGNREAEEITREVRRAHAALEDEEWRQNQFLSAVATKLAKARNAGRVDEEMLRIWVKELERLSQHDELDDELRERAMNLRIEAEGLISDWRHRA